MTAVTPHRRLTLMWFCFAVFGSTAAPQQAALTQEVPRLACIVAADADTGTVLNTRNFPGGGVLIWADKGLFLAREVGGKVSIAPAGDADIRSVRGMRDFPGGGVLIGAQKGLFLAREEGGKVSVAPAGDADTGYVLGMGDFPGGGVLIQAEKGLFLAHEVGGKVSIAPAGDADTGRVLNTRSFPGGGVLIWADKGLFLAREVGGKVSIAPAGDADIGFVLGMRDFSGGGVLIGAQKGLFLAREADGKVTVAPVGDADHGSVHRVHEFRGGSVLIGAEKGLFLAREVGGRVSVAPAGDAGTGSVNEMRDFPGGGVLIGAEKGLFLAREVGGKVSVAPAGDADTGSVNEMRDFPGGGVLIRAKKGWFLAREVGGEVSVAPAGDADTGRVYDMRDFPGRWVLIVAEKGLFLTVQTPLARAQVDIGDKKNWEGSAIGPRRNLLVFTIAHECARSADKLALNVRVVAPGDEPPGKLMEGIERITPGATVAELRISSVFDKPGRWSFQVVATSGGVERPVGEPQTLNLEGPWWERGWRILTIGFGVALASMNFVLFGLARRSAWAWRLATDDGWGTWALRIATLALSHVRLAQLWILDFYFQRVRGRLQEPRPFFPLPLTATDGSLQAGTDVLAAPWKGRRLWLQGASGMGKTAVFRYITESHFREHDTTFTACAKWGCIVVPFAARDFASSGEDKDDPAWVVDAVRATLSSEGLTFASSTLLSRLLESGTIGVAIDGLNEVDRTRAVAAFSRTFSEAPMLITSQQQPGSDRFVTWRLPADIRHFTFDLLRLYLNEHAEAVMERITTSGLQHAIRSGYDVRLVIDLALADPHYAKLPADRMRLYAAVIEAGWPDVPEDVRQEQQSLTAAAAWRMVSERKPNEDMRRLKPDVDLPANHLVALADASKNDNRPVRLVRRVGAGAFEFVHDQMHAYLAARWFAQDGFSTTELEKMIAGSTIWIQTPDARRILWGFAAALLDDACLLELLVRIEDKEEWDVLRRALKAEAERRGLPTPRKPEVEKTGGH
jgi:hypothetical protein